MRGELAVIALLLVLIFIFTIAACQEKHIFGWQAEEEINEGL